MVGSPWTTSRPGVASAPRRTRRRRTSRRRPSRRRPRRRRRWAPCSSGRSCSGSAPSVPPELRPRGVAAARLPVAGAPGGATVGAGTGTEVLVEVLCPADTSGPGAVDVPDVRDAAACPTGTGSGGQRPPLGVVTDGGTVYPVPVISSSDASRSGHRTCSRAGPVPSRCATRRASRVRPSDRPGMAGPAQRRLVRQRHPRQPERGGRSWLPVTPRVPSPCGTVTACAWASDSSSSPGGRRSSRRSPAEAAAVDRNAETDRGLRVPPGARPGRAQPTCTWRGRRVASGSRPTRSRSSCCPARNRRLRRPGRRAEPLRLARLPQAGPDVRRPADGGVLRDAPRAAGVTGRTGRDPDPPGAPAGRRAGGSGAHEMHEAGSAHRGIEHEHPAGQGRRRPG